MVAGKLLDRQHGMAAPEDEEFSALTGALRAAPRDRFPVPLTASMEVGWCAMQNTAVQDRSGMEEFGLRCYEYRWDPRVSFPRRRGELSGYQERYWSVTSDAPAANMNVRRKVDS